MPPEGCLVEGIAFFGTPFTRRIVVDSEPSTGGLACGLRIPFVWKKQHTRKSGQMDPKHVQPIVDQFWSLAADYNIPLLTSFEEKKTWSPRVVSQIISRSIRGTN